MHVFYMSLYKQLTINYTSNILYSNIEVIDLSRSSEVKGKPIPDYQCSVNPEHNFILTQMHV